MSTIERLIPSEWRDEIVVLDAGMLDAPRDGHPTGATFARVGAVDWIAWRQAITSLAPHVDNDIEDWLGGGERTEQYGHVITVWNPTVTVKQGAIAHHG
ncbi:MAG TPA: hypothetical protein VK501_28535 [Baekduia sp.]|uniref:hypothetical protein n=1 Tax=Baekduia sp. TaxID=2600305 RepID=UPI002B83181D|nr:hypothetical protein [Baekduia sp.]HMJ37890.1 hypothetical protein [Baekduia sp.]